MSVAQNKLVYLQRAINTDLGQAEFDDEKDDKFSLSASANSPDTKA